MMTTDSERREMAENLRYLADYPGTPVLYAEQFRDELSTVVLPDGFTHDYSELLQRLADLIEPGEPKVRCVAEVKVDGERLEKLAHDAVVELTGIDRYELLEEVKELEKCAWYFGLDFDEDEPLRDRLKEASEDFAGSARRIREALGASDG